MFFPGAVRQVREHDGEIRLLITDVVMPEMNGGDLAERLLALDPSVECLFVSGYFAQGTARFAALGEDVHFLQKPFSLDALAAKVRDVLDRS